MNYGASLISSTHTDLAIRRDKPAGTEAVILAENFRTTFNVH